MKLTGVLKIAGLILGIIIIAIILFFGIFMLDIFSYFATGIETLSPEGASTGSALIVYNPGGSGMTKDAAYIMAEELRSRGYEVNVAGIKNNGIYDIQGYDVLIAGSPTYALNPTSSVRSYLEAIQPSENTSIGVFATGSSPEKPDKPDANRVMVSILEERSIKVKASMKLIPGDDMKSRCAEFVTRVLS